MTAKPRVLVVEDDASIRRFVVLALEDEPIELLQAERMAHTLRSVAANIGAQALSQQAQALE